MMVAHSSAFIVKPSTHTQDSFGQTHEAVLSATTAPDVTPQVPPPHPPTAQPPTATPPVPPSTTAQPPQVRAYTHIATITVQLIHLPTHTPVSKYQGVPRMPPLCLNTRGFPVCLPLCLNTRGFPVCLPVSKHQGVPVCLPVSKHQGVPRMPPCV